IRHKARKHAGCGRYCLHSIFHNNAFRRPRHATDGGRRRGRSSWRRPAPGCRPHQHPNRRHTAHYRRKRDLRWHNTLPGAHRAKGYASRGCPQCTWHPRALFGAEKQRGKQVAGRCAVKRLLWLATLACAAVLTACGGSGSSSIPPPTPTGGFSVSSLKGQYAYSMSGLDAGGYYISRVGSFSADGAGNISSAMEDVVDLGQATPFGQVTFTGGSYSVQANGRGVIVLQAGSGNGLQLTMILQSTSQGYLLETDGNSGTSGNFILQTAADFATTALNGNYVFDFSGISLTGAAPTVVSTVGYIAATGNGIITGGLNDINDGNAGISGPVTIAPGTFTL